MLVLINYDLKRVKDYPRLYECFQIWSAKEILESCWIANVIGPPNAARDALRGFVDGDDALFVVEIADGARWATMNVVGQGFEMLKAQSILTAA